MSYGYVVIAVDLKDILALQADEVEARNEVSDRIKEVESDRFPELNDMLDAVRDPDEPPPELSAEIALDDIIFSRPMDDQFGFLYGYALEALCLEFGERLPDCDWFSTRREWRDKAQQALDACGVDPNVITYSDWTLRGPPIPIPEADDFPFIGYILAAEIEPALHELEKATSDKLEPNVAAAIDEVRQWLTTCHKLRRDLVSFYY